MENISPEIQNYIDILEKTNQQLSLWYNPYGIMVGGLTVLFTILTIVAVVIIYRQGHDYKEKIEADRELYKKKFDEFLASQMEIIKQKSETAKEISNKIDNILEEYKKKLEESSEEQKQEIQKAIDKLELEKLTLKTAIGPTTVTPNIDYMDYLSSAYASVGIKKLHKCSHCGFGFYVATSPYSSALANLLSPNTVTCPKCKNVETI